METRDLHYDESTLLQPLDMNEVHRVEDWLRRSGEMIIPFDHEYLEHLTRFHGGVPALRVFDTQSGQDHLIERFYNFSVVERPDPLVDFKVFTVWSQIDDRLGPYLLPFAELFGGDILCFDYTNGFPPSVVVWLHDQSEPDTPVTDFVAETFNSLLELLRAVNDTV